MDPVKMLEQVQAIALDARRSDFSRGTELWDLVSVDPEQVVAHIKAEALREAADGLADPQVRLPHGSSVRWLRAEAKRIAGMG